MKLHDTIDVLIGGYLSKDAAEEDYNAVLDAVAISRAPWSSARTSTATSRSRRPTTWSARGPRAWAPSASRSGCSPRRCSPATAVGAAMGGAAGGLLHHKTAEKLGEEAGETIPLGGAGLIVAYSQSEAERSSPR